MPFRILRLQTAARKESTVDENDPPKFDYRAVAKTKCSDIQGFSFDFKFGDYKQQNACSWIQSLIEKCYQTN